MGWLFSPERAIYLQAAERIALRIFCGEYAKGGKIPSVRELAFEAEINPNTMQRALSELEARGLVSAQRTSGRVVTDDDRLIERERSAFAVRLSNEYLMRMAGLGCTRAEAISILNRGDNGNV